MILHPPPPLKTPGPILLPTIFITIKFRPSPSPTVAEVEVRMCGSGGVSEPRKLSSLALTVVVRLSELSEEDRERTEKAFARILLPLLSELQATKLQLLRSGQLMKK